MIDISTLESKTYLEYCTFLERFLERVESMEAQIKEMKENNGKPTAKRTSKT